MNREHPTATPALRGHVVETLDGVGLSAWRQRRETARQAVTAATEDVGLLWDRRPSNHGLAERHARKLSAATGEAAAVGDGDTGAAPRPERINGETST